MWNFARDIGTETCCLLAEQRPPIEARQHYPDLLKVGCARRATLSLIHAGCCDLSQQKLNFSQWTTIESFANNQDESAFAKPAHAKVC
jgi:hypothetical protein